MAEKKKIIVTGSNGRIASALFNLWKEDYDVIRVSRSSSEGAFSYEELWNQDDLGQVDAVIHTAWSVVPATAQQEPDLYKEQDLPLLESLFDFVEKQKSRLLFFSTGSVYGNYEEECEEEVSPKPVSEYAKSKLDCENLIRKVATEKNFPAIILRISNVYGFHLKTGIPQGVIPVLLNCVVNNDEFSIWGDGKNKKDYIHVKDLSELIPRFFDYNDGVAVFNIASGEPASVLELIHHVEKVSQKELLVKHLDGSDWDLKCNLLSNKKLVRYVGDYRFSSIKDAIETDYASLL